MVCRIGICGLFSAICPTFVSVTMKTSQLDVKKETVILLWLYKLFCTYTSNNTVNQDKALSLSYLRISCGHSHFDVRRKLLSGYLLAYTVKCTHIHMPFCLFSMAKWTPFTYFWYENVNFIMWCLNWLHIGPLYGLYIFKL